MRKPIALLAGLALALSASATALAYPSPDTALDAEFDEEQMVLVYTVSGFDGDTVGGVEFEDEVDVTGPDGQVNHGTIVGSFVESLREQGWVGGVGCLARHIARTDWGKTDDEVTDPTAETLDEILTACHPGNQDSVDEVGDAEATGHGQGKVRVRGGDWQPGSGPPPWAGSNGKGKGNGDD